MDVCYDSPDGNWEFANTLGEGAYGEVKLAVNKNQETRAVKILKYKKLNNFFSIMHTNYNSILKFKSNE
jgi:hypothetical protein